METMKKRDWGLIVAGVLLLICGILFFWAPWLTLVTLTAIAGAAFLVSGVFDIINYVRFRKVMDLSGWVLAYAVLDIIIGLMLLLQPVDFAVVLPWFVGAIFIVFGIFEIVGAFKVRGSGISLWGWVLFSGIVGILCGLAFVIFPATFSIFLAIFVIMRGASLIFYGMNAGRAMA